MYVTTLNLFQATCIAFLLLCVAYAVLAVIDRGDRH